MYAPFHLTTTAILIIWSQHSATHVGKICSNHHHEIYYFTIDFNIFSLFHVVVLYNTV